MCTNFSKRILAFIIDYIIVSLIVSLITLNFNGSNSSDDIKKLEQKLQDNEITYNEYYDEYVDLYYGNSKDIFAVNVIFVIIMIGYYIVFVYLNHGVSLGKKLLRIKIVNKDDKDVSFKELLIRSLFLYNIMSALLNVSLIKVLSKDSFCQVIFSVSIIESLLLIITIIFMLYNKNKKGLHDIIAGTKVIDMKEV